MAITGQSAKQPVRIGELLIQAGLLTPAQLEEALNYQKSSKTGEKIGEILINRQYVSEDDFVNTLHKKLEVPVVDLTRLRVNSAACALVPLAIAQKYTLLPLEYDEFSITVAMWNPADFYAIEEIEMITRRRARPMIAKKSTLMHSIHRAYDNSIASDVIDSANREHVQEFTGFDAETEERISNAPMVQLVDAMLTQAQKMRASDIHVEPMNDRVRVRFRVDGELLEIMALNLSVLGNLVSRLKNMSGMDIAEKRLPQDGRFTAIISGRELHTRVACMPTIYGEKVVVRLLGDASTDVPDVSQLGMTDQNRKLFLRLLDVPSGIILVTGPTGSGKTTTLYSAVRRIAKPAVNVISIEDPVEKSIDGVNQMQINEKAGVTFASGLRSLLRQDPDVIMIGEIRDPDTAQIAARAAITGHIVLSTLHTNDAVSTPSRLIDMGVEPYIVGSAIQGIVAQRLTRLLCPYCKRRVALTPQEKTMTPEMQVGEPVFEPVGCVQCNNTGYRGRTAVHEILTVTSNLRELISGNRPLSEIRHCAQAEGNMTLRENLVQLVRAGSTSMAELLRLTFSLD